MPTLAEDVVVAGRFRLIRKLGQGGMGSVWLATHLGLDTPCAIKFIEGEFAHIPEMQARFEREAKAAASLRSPNVVQIIDHAIWDGVPFIAMELLDGEDLRHRLERVGRLTPHQTVDVLGQVCRALNKAHALGIVHRDLKPDNIYLVRDDDREIAKVLDFGIAKSSKTGLDAGSNTKTGAMLGTPYYMSPEQARGIKAVDLRSDLWSMGIIAYQCITGQLPFESESLGDLLMKIMVSPLPVPSQVAPVPPGFDAWWAKAAAREPADRFQSAREFIDSLSQALGARSGSLAGTDPGTAGMQHAPQTGTLPLGAMTPNPLATPNPVAHTFGDAAPASKRSSMGIMVAAAGALVLAGAGVATVVMLHGRGADAGSVSKDPTPAMSTVVPTPPETAASTASAAVGATAAPPPSASAAPSARAAGADSATATAHGNKPHAGSHPHAATGATARPTATTHTATAAPTAAATATSKGDLGF